MYIGTLISTTNMCLFRFWWCFVSIPVDPSSTIQQQIISCFVLHQRHTQMFIPPLVPTTSSTSFFSTIQTSKFRHFFQSSKIINIHPKSISDLIKYLSLLLDLRVSAQFLWSAPVANAWGTACASASPSAPARHGPSPWDLRLPAPRMRPSSAPHRPGVEKPLANKMNKGYYVCIYI